MFGTEFRCPKCGGSYFGSSDLTTDNWKGHCGDQFGRGCRFTWMRSDDDKYFSKTKECLEEQLKEANHRLALFKKSIFDFDTHDGHVELTMDVDAFESMEPVPDDWEEEYD